MSQCKNSGFQTKTSEVSLINKLKDMEQRASDLGANIEEM